MLSRHRFAGQGSLRSSRTLNDPLSIVSGQWWLRFGRVCSQVSLTGLETRLVLAPTAFGPFASTILARR